MPGWSVAMIVVFSVGADVAVVLAIRSIILQMFRKWQGRYPPVEVAPGAVTRRFQSFAFGLMNAGMCVHVSVDEHCLHLRPARFVRWFGMRPVSVPWEAFGDVKRRGKRYTQVMLDKTLITGPTWCMSLIDGPEAVGTPDATGVE